MSRKPSRFFACTANTARSRIAEALLRCLRPGTYDEIQQRIQMCLLVTEKE